MTHTWYTAQIGAREHYSIPRALHQQRCLQQLFTDAWVPHGKEWLGRGPDIMQSLANRYHPGLPKQKVTSFTAWSIAHRLRRIARLPPPGVDILKHYLHFGSLFATKVCHELKHNWTIDSDSVFFGYDTGSLEVLEFLEDTDCFTIVDQVDPGRVQTSIIREEVRRWPEWTQTQPVHYEPYEDRRQAEWELASCVVVNSEWSKEALLTQGVPDDKIHVVPLAYERQMSTSASLEPAISSSSRPLRVLWLGTVSLTKGIQYLTEAAQKLEKAPVHFDIVGPINITEKVLSKMPTNMTFHGRVPRDEVSTYYQNADLFVLPTLSDGFAITQLEAMAHGLPVLTTPNCGRVVNDGENGYLVPPRDSEMMADTLARLCDNRDRIYAMSQKALKTVDAYSLDRVARNLLSIVKD